MDLDRVTRRFADSFQSVHAALAAGFRGRRDEAQRRSAASDVLNRLMFARFTRGSAGGENARDVRQAVAGAAQRNGRSSAAPRFRNGHAPSLSDAACRLLLEFARRWEWRLTDGPPAHADEVTPDVLGLILEQHVNQRQTGSYYTRADVTRYIAQAAIIPGLLDAVASRCPDSHSFESTLRRQLIAAPLRYVHRPMRKGAIGDDGKIVRLPRHVAAGICCADRRESWNAPADPAFALPDETWRDVVERRTRCLAILASLRAGEFHSIDDLVTWNLDLGRLASDVIAAIDDPRLVEAFYRVLAGRNANGRSAGAAAPFRVLDPTCGSGAFLIAALEVLEPLYEACLAQAEPSADSRSRRDCVRRTIISRNLYGVDLLPEAIEMSRLRLRLKIAAAAGEAAGKRGGAAPTRDSENLHVGDALTGRCGERQQASSCDARGSRSPFDWNAAFPRVLSGGGFDVVIGNPPYIETSRGTRQTLTGFEVIRTGNLFALCSERSLDLLQPGGRLGVILPMSAVSTPRMRPLMELFGGRLSPAWLSHFACRPGKLFAGADMNVTIVLGRKRAGDAQHVVARSSVVARSPDRATGPTEGLPARVNGCGDLRSHARRGQETRAERGTRAELETRAELLTRGELFTTGYRRWSKRFRGFLFSTLSYTPTEPLAERGTIPKLQTECERKLLGKLLGFAAEGRLNDRGTSSECVYYHSGGRYFRKCLRRKLSNEYKRLTVPAGWGDAAVCLLSSSLFYWMWIALSDCYHVTDRDLRFLPIAETLVADPELSRLAGRLLDDLWANSETRTRRRADGSTQREVNFDVSRSKPLLDQIDGVLARHFGLTGAERDFIVNYDVRHRMPRHSTTR